MRWLDYTRSNVAGRFSDISQFIEQNPDWPSQKILRRQAETALTSESDDVAAAWLQRFPLSERDGQGTRGGDPDGSRRSRLAGVTALEVQAWIDGDLNLGDEHDFLARYGANIRPEDNVKRLDRLLWDRQEDPARRMLPLVPPDYRAEGIARLALYGRAGDAERAQARGAGAAGAASPTPASSSTSSTGKQHNVTSTKRRHRS